MLHIEGKYEASHILSDMIAREYAICCFWEDKKLRIAHHKGTWTLAKFKNDVLLDRLEANDEGTFTTENTLLLGLVRAVYENQLETEVDATGERERMGKTLAKAIETWVGEAQKIQKITVLQEKRNAWLDSEGEFSFSRSS